MVLASVVFGGVAFLVLLWGLLEERRANKNGNKSGMAALILSGLGILMSIFFALYPVLSVSSDTSEINYKIHFKILAVVFSAVGLLVIIFDKQFDMLLVKKQGQVSPAKITAVCALLLSLCCIWGMFNYPRNNNRSTDHEEFPSAYNPVDDKPEQVFSPEVKTPSPVFRIEEIKVFYMQEEKNDFTMHVGEPSVTIWAKALPYGLPEGKLFEWTCSDTSCLMIEPSEDSVYCTCSIIKPKPEPVELIVSCDGVRRTILVFLRD